MQTLSNKSSTRLAKMKSNVLAWCDWSKGTNVRLESDASTDNLMTLLSVDLPNQRKGYYYEYTQNIRAPGSGRWYTKLFEVFAEVQEEYVDGLVRVRVYLLDGCSCVRGQYSPGLWYNPVPLTVRQMHAIFSSAMETFQNLSSYDRFSGIHWKWPISDQAAPTCELKLVQPQRKQISVSLMYRCGGILFSGCALSVEEKFAIRDIWYRECARLMKGRE
jgi:hypothetical protein